MDDSKDEVMVLLGKSEIEFICKDDEQNDIKLEKTLQS